MNKQRSFSAYRLIDLALWMVILAVFEYIIVRVTHSFFFADQSISVSLAAAISTIMYMRWGIFGGFFAAVSGFLTCLFSEATLDQYMIYIAGNLFSVLAVIPLRLIGREKVRTVDWLAMGLPILVLLLMQAGRAAVAVLLGYDPSLSIGFFTTEAVTDLFTLVIIWISRRLDGLYEDQKHYLIRVHNEEKKKKAFYDESEHII